MLAFLRLFLKFYLADTPHLKMRSILKVGSEQLPHFYLSSCPLYRKFILSCPQALQFIIIKYLKVKNKLVK